MSQFIVYPAVSNKQLGFISTTLAVQVVRRVRLRVKIKTILMLDVNFVGSMKSLEAVILAILKAR